jgi:hypothetical protein
MPYACMSYIRPKHGVLTFSPSDNLTHTVGPSDSWTAVRLVLVTNGPNPKSKVDKQFVHPKNEHLYPKI